MTTQEREAYTLLQQEIGSALIWCLPTDWEAATLTLEATENGLGKGVAHQITNPKGKKDVVFPTDDIFIATRRFELSSVEHHLHWQSVSINVAKSGEAWSVVSHIEYSE